MPIIGLNTLWNLTEHWNFSLTGDYGGFGVDSNEQTWKVEAMVGYRWRGWGVGWSAQWTTRIAPGSMRYTIRHVFLVSRSSTRADSNR